MRRIAAFASLSCHMRKPTYLPTKRVGKSAFFFGGGVIGIRRLKKLFGTAGLIRDEDQKRFKQLF